MSQLQYVPVTEPPKHKKFYATKRPKLQNVLATKQPQYKMFWPQNVLYLGCFLLANLVVVTSWTFCSLERFVFGKFCS
jgi:hypothetical protein